MFRTFAIVSYSVSRYYNLDSVRRKRPTIMRLQNLFPSLLYSQDNFLQDRAFLELDMAFNGAPNNPSETPPPSPDPSLVSLERRRSTGCCARRFITHRRFFVSKVRYSVFPFGPWVLFRQFAFFFSLLLALLLRIVLHVRISVFCVCLGMRCCIFVYSSLLIGTSCFLSNFRLTLI